MNEQVRFRGYHHGDLRNALKTAARTILEDEGLAALSLRAVARKAGVSHAAPYRHYPNHEALLVELALEGFGELCGDIRAAGAAPRSQRREWPGTPAAGRFPRQPPDSCPARG